MTYRRVWPPKGMEEVVEVSEAQVVEDAFGNRVSVPSKFRVWLEPESDCPEGTDTP